MSFSTDFASKYGVKSQGTSVTPTTTGGSASLRFANSVKAGQIKQIEPVQTPQPVIQKTTTINKIKTAVGGFLSNLKNKTGAGKELQNKLSQSSNIDTINLKPEIKQKVVQNLITQTPSINQSATLSKPYSEIAQKRTEENIQKIKNIEEKSKPILTEIAQRTSGTGIAATIKSASPEVTFKQAYEVMRKSQQEKNDTLVEQFITGLTDTLPQTALGVALGFVPFVGPALSTSYWAAISAGSEIEEKGYATPTNVAIDVIGDRILGGMVEKLFKTPAKSLLKTIKKSFVVEGGTEVAQDLLKFSNDYRLSKTEEEKKLIIDKTKNYFTSGQILVTAGVGGISGAGIATVATGINKVANKNIFSPDDIQDSLINSTLLDTEESKKVEEIIKQAKDNDQQIEVRTDGQGDIVVDTPEGDKIGLSLSGKNKAEEIKEPKSNVEIRNGYEITTDKNGVQDYKPTSPIKTGEITTPEVSPIKTNNIIPDEIKQSIKNKTLSQINKNNGIINNDGSINLYHGTTNENYNSIINNGFKKMSWFADKKNGYTDLYGEGRNGKLMSIKIDPSAVKPTKNGSYVAMGDLFLDKDGIYKLSGNNLTLDYKKYYSKNISNDVEKEIKSTPKVSPIKTGERKNLTIKEAEQIKEEAVSKAEVAKEQRASVNENNIALAKRIVNSRAYQENDIEFVRKRLSVEQNQRIDDIVEDGRNANGQDMSETDAIEYVAGLPTKAETKVKLPEEYKSFVKKRKKAKLSQDNKILKSRVFERLKLENEALTGEVEISAINLDKEAERAVRLIEKDKQRAFNIAMGYITSDKVTSTAVNIAMAEKALEENNIPLYNKLIKKRSLEQTRRGQEIVSEKLSITDNSTSRYVKELLSSRLDKLGSKYLSDTGLGKNKKSSKQRAMEAINNKVTDLETKVKSKKLDVKTALSLLEKITCV